MNKVIPENIKDILIVRIGKIGDIIATSFVFEVIKRNNPAAKIFLITRDSNKNILKYNTSIDEVFYIGAGDKRYFQLVKLRKRKFDLIMDFNDNPSRTTKMIFSSFNGNIKCGYQFDLYEKYLDIKIIQPDQKRTHIIDRMAYFLETAGFRIEPGIKKPFFYTGFEEENEVKKVLAPFSDKKIIAINISAGAPIRYWNASNWGSLIKLIASLEDKFIFLLLSLKEDRPVAEEIAAMAGKADILLPENKSFQHFASYIKNSYMLISPDTSAVHIASSFKVPVLAMYPDSEWNFASWSPYKTPNRSVRSSSEGLNSISIDEVFNNFVELNNEIKVNE